MFIPLAMLSTWVWFPVFGDADPVKVLIMSIFVVFATIYLAYGKFEPENIYITSFFIRYEKNHWWRRIRSFTGRMGCCCG